MSLQDLPTVNAILNSICTVLLVIGWGLIRRGRREAHRKVMLAAFATSILFLVSYLTYHFQVGATKFAGEGVWRPIYFAILVSHTVLAAIVAPMVLVTLYRGLSQKFDKHRKIARWTLPIWLYVSVTGVGVYVMLYHVFPSR